MSTITVETRITRKYLMNKSKYDLASDALWFLDELDKSQKEVAHLKEIINKEIAPYLAALAMLHDDGDAMDLRERILSAIGEIS